MKKAQMQQIFVYILGVVIMGMLVLFAYKGIGSIMKTSSQADLEKFKTDFRNTIDEMSAYGRGRVETIKTPANFGKLCLIDKTNQQGTLDIDLVTQSVAAGSDNTVYLVSVDGTTVEAFKTDPMQVFPEPPASRCFDISIGKVKLQFQGFTRYTQVQEVRETVLS